MVPPELLQEVLVEPLLRGSLGEARLEHAQAGAQAVLRLPAGAELTLHVGPRRADEVLGPFSNIGAIFRGIFKRVVTCPVYFYWNRPMDFQWCFPVDVYFCDFLCEIFCPEYFKLCYH